MLSPGGAREAAMARQARAVGPEDAARGRDACAWAEKPAPWSQNSDPYTLKCSALPTASESWILRKGAASFDTARAFVLCREDTIVGGKALALDIVKILSKWGR